jgi:ABC-2 type transport system ATP-binding protein
MIDTFISNGLFQLAFKTVAKEGFRMVVAVATKGLVKVYNGTVRALDGVDLEVEAGIAFALLGPNGAGKTTLMRILTTQLRPLSGEAYVSG